MKSSGKKLSLSSYDDIFKTDESRQDDMYERVMEVPLEKLVHFHDHPFQIRRGEALQDMADSISRHGVLSPGLVRPLPDGTYEVVSGNSRMEASILAGKDTMPVIIRDLSDDEAIIAMVDANLQRENILPSERAFAYKMKLDAIKRQGERSDLTSAQLVPKLTAREKVAQEAGVNRMEITRFVRLTELIPPILDMVDDKRIAFNAAVELSYLSLEEQAMLTNAMEAQEVTPSLSQAKRLKKLSQVGKLNEESMLAIMSEEKKEVEKITIASNILSKYFPKSYTPKQMQDTILKLLEQWQRRRQHDVETK